MKAIVRQKVLSRRVSKEGNSKMTLRWGIVSPHIRIALGEVENRSLQCR